VVAGDGHHLGALRLEAEPHDLAGGDEGRQQVKDEEGGPGTPAAGEGSIPGAALSGPPPCQIVPPGASGTPWRATLRLDPEDRGLSRGGERFAPRHFVLSFTCQRLMRSTPVGPKDSTLGQHGAKTIDVT
jgi:hypothetical protein